MEGIYMSERISNIHPGEILEEDFLKPLGISAYRLAKETHIPPTRISEILKHRRRISADTALRFSKYFGNSPDFWLGIQMEYDLREEKEKHKADIDTIKTIEIAV
jgi:addiction module HigA family antidote